MESEYEECALSVGTHSYRCVEVDGDFVDSMSPNIKLKIQTTSLCRHKLARIQNLYISP